MLAMIFPEGGKQVYYNQQNLLINSEGQNRNHIHLILFRNLINSNIVAIEPTSTLWGLDESTDVKWRRQYPHGERQLIAVAGDLHDVHPEKHNFYADTFQVGDLVFADFSADGGLVFEIVAFDGVRARLTQVRLKFSSVLVESVACDSQWKQTRREIVLFEGFVSCEWGGGVEKWKR